MFVWLWSTVGTFALGLFLVVRGWRGRRRGGEPHCRKCDYILHGLEGRKCPECGTKLGPRTIAVGARRRSWMFIACGALVLVLGLLSSQSAFLAIKARQHHFFPFRLLVDRAAGGDQRAMTELGIRIREKRLSEDQAHRLADRSLTMVGATPSPSTPWWLRLVELDDANLLLDTHRERMANRATSPTLLARSEIRQGEPLAVELRFFAAGLSPYSRRFEPTEIRVGNRVVYPVERGADPPVEFSPLSTDWNTGIQFYGYVLDSTDFPTGDTKLVVEGRYQFIGSWETPQKANASRSKKQRLETSITILAPDDPDPVTWVERPDLGAILREHMRISLNEVCPEEVYEGSYVRFDRIERTGELYDIPLSNCGRFRWDPCPVPIAMKVIVEVGGVERSTKLFGAHPPFACGIVVPAGRSWQEWGLIARTPVFEEDEFYIILRSSKDVARRTLNMDSVWHGELRYGPFSVRHDVVDGSP